MLGQMCMVYHKMHSVDASRVSHRGRDVTIVSTHDAVDRQRKNTASNPFDIMQ